MRREELEAGMEGEALVSGELKTDRTNRNTLCSDVIMRCTLRMCSEYGPLATLTVCTQRTIRQLLLRVRNSATLSDMTAPCCAICTTHRVYGIHVELWNSVIMTFRRNLNSKSITVSLTTSFLFFFFLFRDGSLSKIWFIAIFLVNKTH